MKRTLAAYAAVIALSACAAPGARETTLSAGERATLERQLERQLSGQSQTSGSRLEQLIATAASHPLGSSRNPVRADAPAGQRAYLARLRCSDGTAPRFQRRGSVGPQVFGNIIDDYQVDCGTAAPGQVSVRMDLYHPGYVETRAVPGFTIDAGVAAAPVA